MSVQSRGILVHRSSDDRSRTPSYRSDTASTRDTIQFQDLQVFRQYPMQPLPSGPPSLVMQPSPVPSAAGQTSVKSQARKSQQTITSGADNASRQLSTLGEGILRKNLIIRFSESNLLSLKPKNTEWQRFYVKMNTNQIFMKFPQKNLTDKQQP